MKIFLDTANLDEIRQGVEMGVVDGVTTNPTLIAKEGKPFRQHILDICGVVNKRCGERTEWFPPIPPVFCARPAK